MRMGRRRRRGIGGAVAAAVAAAAFSTASSQQAQILRTEDALVAIFALQTEIEVEERLMTRQEQKYEVNVQRRVLLRDRLDLLYDELELLFLKERAVRAGQPASEEDGGTPPGEILRQAEEKEDEIRALEMTEAGARDEGRRIREEVRKIQERIKILSEKQASLRVRMPDDSDSVTGLWDIRFLPSGDRGVFALWQSGTLVSGQYVLDGPFLGSLEGTLINRQLLVRRIDSSLGRTGTLSGYLTEDGQTLQGTWDNYDLSSGKAPRGSWSATKRSSTPSAATSPQGEAP